MSEGRTSERQDPFGAFPTGTHTRLQPQLIDFYRQVLQPYDGHRGAARPTTGFQISGKPTLEEIAKRGGVRLPLTPVPTSSRDYADLARRCGEEPRSSSRTELHAAHRQDRGGNYLWLTPVETETGPISNPVDV